MTISPVSHAGIVCTVTVPRAMATGEPTATSHHHRQDKTQRKRRTQLCRAFPRTGAGLAPVGDDDRAYRNVGTRRWRALCRGC